MLTCTFLTPLNTLQAIITTKPKGPGTGLGYRPCHGSQGAVTSDGNMAPLERWYKKWETLEDDSDEQSVAKSNHAKDCGSLPLKHLPPDVAEALQQEKHPEQREALLALNSFIAELHKPPRSSPASLQRLLPFLSNSLRGLKEGGEVERLLWQVHAILHHPKVSHRKLEESAGACALCALRDQEDSATLSRLDLRLVSTILRSVTDRIHEFSACSLARTAWSAAALKHSNNSQNAHLSHMHSLHIQDSASLLLEKALQKAEDLLPHFVAEDISLLAVCSTESPSGVELLRKLNAQDDRKTEEPNKEEQRTKGRRNLEEQWIGSKKHSVFSDGSRWNECLEAWQACHEPKAPCKASGKMAEVNELPSLPQPIAFIPVD